MKRIRGFFIKGIKERRFGDGVTVFFKGCYGVEYICMVFFGGYSWNWRVDVLGR